MIETNIVSFISISDAVNIVYKNISTTSNNFMSGIDTLDLLTNGWLPGKLCVVGAENGGYPPTQNGYIRSLFMLFTLMAMQN